MNIKYRLLEQILNNRHKPPLLSIWDKDKSTPPQTIVITDSMRNFFKGRVEINDQELIDFAKENTDGCVESDYSATALNTINSLYYSSCEQAFTKDSDLANLFVKDRMVARTMMYKLLNEIKSINIKVKEICAGGRYSRWQHFSEFLPKDRSMEVILADISKDIIPIERINSKKLPRMKFNAESYDLRDDFPEINTPEKLDVIIVTYGFDSVWLPEDLMYYKKKNDWYKISYRVKVLPSSHSNRILQVLRQGFVRPFLTLNDFKDIIVEVVAEKIASEDLFYKDFLLNLYGDYDEMRINIPSTLVKRVEQAFSTQLKENGIFMIGEVGIYPIKSDQKIETTIADYNTTGKVGKYKVEDLWIAENILVQKGFAVEVHALEKLANSYGKKISQDTEDTWLMIVKKK